MPIGESIDRGVADQIALREDVYGRENNRSDSDLRYLSSREGWVRVISFVKDINNTDIAKSLVLGGAPGRYSDAPVITEEGEIVLTNTLVPFDLGVEDIKEQGYYTPSGINFSGNTGRFYNYSRSTGVRPMPGLTSFSVKSKNTYGTLREATIGFVVWSKEDLNLVEKLYLRLGFEVLVEWGHTYYLDSSGDLAQPNFSDYEQFFQREAVLETDVLNHIKKKREFSDYNQEGMLGYIKNFSWTFREDGGYDCSISVISTGDIIESLTMKLGSKTNTEGSEIAGSLRYRRSDFHALSFFMGDSLKDDDDDEDDDVTNIIRIKTGLITFKDIDDNSNRIVTNTEGEYASSLTKLNSTLGRDISGALKLLETDNIGYVDRVRVEESKYWPDWLFKSEDKFLKYIPLRVFLAMVNMINQREGGPTLFDLNPGEKYLSFREQTSIAPYVAVLPKTSLLNNILAPGEYNQPYYINLVRALSSFSNFNNIPFNEVDGKQEEEILSIFVNLDMIVGKVDDRLERDEDAVIDFVKSVLSEINRAMANTIDLDVTFDDDTSLHRIVDRKNLPRRDPELVPIIQGSGKKSTFSSLSINSKITNKLGAQISIAAQAGPTSYDGVAKFKEWNQDLTSKIVRRNVTETTKATDQTEGEKKDFRQLVTEAYEILNTATDETNDETALDVDIFSEVTPLGKKYYEEILEKVEELPKGLIPIELSFKTEGIGGLKIGQSFKLSSRRLLPDRYNNPRFAFIITGLEHSIENQRWYTNVTAQTFLLRKP